jgi:hypothetical protein
VLGKDAYVLFDLPGQVELSTNHESLKRIVQRLSKGGFRVRCTIAIREFSADGAISSSPRSTSATHTM